MKKLFGKKNSSADMTVDAAREAAAKVASAGGRGTASPGRGGGRGAPPGTGLVAGRGAGGRGQAPAMAPLQQPPTASPKKAGLAAPPVGNMADKSGAASQGLSKASKAGQGSTTSGKGKKSAQSTDPKTQEQTSGDSGKKQVHSEAAMLAKANLEQKWELEDVRQDRDDWKGKAKALQSSHNTPDLVMELKKEVIDWREKAINLETEFNKGIHANLAHLNSQFDEYNNKVKSAQDHADNMKQQIVDLQSQIENKFILDKAAKTEIESLRADNKKLMEEKKMNDIKLQVAAEEVSKREVEFDAKKTENESLRRKADAGEAASKVTVQQTNAVIVMRAKYESMYSQLVKATREAEYWRVKAESLGDEEHKKMAIWLMELSKQSDSSTTSGDMGDRDVFEQIQMKIKQVADELVTWKVRAAALEQDLVRCTHEQKLWEARSGDFEKRAKKCNDELKEVAVKMEIDNADRDSLVKVLSVMDTLSSTTLLPEQTINSIEYSENDKTEAKEYQPSINSGLPSLTTRKALKDVWKDCFAGLNTSLLDITLPAENDTMFWISEVERLKEEISNSKEHNDSENLSMKDAQAAIDTWRSTAEILTEESEQLRETNKTQKDRLEVLEKQLSDWGQRMEIMQAKVAQVESFEEKMGSGGAGGGGSNANINDMAAAREREMYMNNIYELENQVSELKGIIKQRDEMAGRFRSKNKRVQTIIDSIKDQIGSSAGGAGGSSARVVSMVDQLSLVMRDDGNSGGAAAGGAGRMVLDEDGISGAVSRVDFNPSSPAASLTTRPKSGGWKSSPLASNTNNNTNTTNVGAGGGG